MALFKICRGNESNLPTTLTDGYAYFCTDTGNFYIDWADNNGNVSREHISSKYATKLRYKDDSGEWVEIDAKDLTNITVEQVQADFAEVDTNKPSFIKNKIVGYKADIVPESTWSFVYDSHWYNPRGNVAGLDFGENVDYIVTLDGVDYECTSTLFKWKSDKGIIVSAYGVGNPQLLVHNSVHYSLISGTSNDLPFFISGVWSFTKSEGDHNIRIRLADNIIKLDKQFLPDLQSDWDQTDDTQPDYIKNKPHIPTLPKYTKVASSGNYNDLGCKPYGDFTILPESSIFFTSVGVGIDGLYIASHKDGENSVLLQAQDAIAPGERYVVVWDGTEYTLTAGNVSDFCSGYEQTSYIGNQARFYGGLGTSIDSGEPFIITSYDGTGLGIMADTPGFHTISITPINKVRKIDRKYLPDELATKQDVEEIARQLAAILPAFTSVDEGKVLGIKNGKLAWVKVQTDQTDEPIGMDATVDGNVLVLGDGAYADGNVLVLGDGVSVDGNTLVFSGETKESDASGNGTTLILGG